METMKLLIKTAEFLILTVTFGLAVAEEPAPLLAPLLLGQEAQGPWWMQETALSPTGGLRLDTKPWWGKAAALETGASFQVEGGRSLVRRETFKDRSGHPQDAIVWVIDDDEDGSLASGGDRDSDCYVADYGRDGTVDRMVDYLDDDGDHDPDEMDIRYFVDGELRYTWFGMDLDDDSADVESERVRVRRPQLFRERPVRRQHDLHEQARHGLGRMVADFRMPICILRYRRRQAKRGSGSRAARSRSATTPTPTPITPTITATSPRRGNRHWRGWAS